VRKDKGAKKINFAKKRRGKKSKIFLFCFGLFNRINF
jgi:hypothetical protein